MSKTPISSFSLQNSNFRFKFFFDQNIDFVLGSFDMLNYLIGKMPSHCVRALDARGNTPLHHAVQRDSRECANLLLRNGASSRVRNNARQTPLDMVRQFQGITPHANLGTTFLF